MKNIELEFSQTVKYNVNIEVTEKTFKLLEGLEYTDVPQHVPKNGRLYPNPVYDILQQYALEGNIFDAEDEMCSVTCKVKE